jgi:hypothetical protein
VQRWEKLADSSRTLFIKDTTNANRPASEITSSYTSSFLQKIKYMPVLPTSPSANLEAGLGLLRSQVLPVHMSSNRVRNAQLKN